MSRVITSPVKRWPGSVTLADPMNYPQLWAWQDAYARAREFTRPGEEDGTFYVTNPARYHGALKAGFLACIESHTLRGLPAQLTEETFPATPIKSAVQLAQWLSDEIAGVIADEDELPNG